MRLVRGGRAQIEPMNDLGALDAGLQTRRDRDRDEGIAHVAHGRGQLDLADAHARDRAAQLRAADRQRAALDDPVVRAGLGLDRVDHRPAPRDRRDVGHGTGSALFRLRVLSIRTTDAWYTADGR